MQYFFCSQFATAVLTTSFAFRVEKAGPLLTHGVTSLSFFNLFLSRVLILSISAAPFSGQALVIAADRVTFASSTLSE